MAIPGFSAQHSVYKSASTYISAYGPNFLASGGSGGADDAHAGVSRLQGSWVVMAQTSCDSTALNLCERRAARANSLCLLACPGSGVRSVFCRLSCAKVLTGALRGCHSEFGCPSGSCCGHNCCGSTQVCTDRTTGACVSCNPLTHTYCPVIDALGRHTGSCCNGANVQCCPTGCPVQGECPAG
jgi:hypothetical protein